MLPDVSEPVRDRLHRLGARTMEISQNIDELFEKPQISAAIDIGGVINTGVFVAEPSASTFRHMLEVYETAPSYNRGDQGFINWYFRDAVHSLDGSYNIMAKFAHASAIISNHVKQNTAKVLHYTSRTKPWNVYYSYDAEWKDNYDPYLFRIWSRARREMQATLQPNISATQVRISRVCDQQMINRRIPPTNQFSVILHVRHPNTQRLRDLVRIYTTSKLVHRIYLVGQVPKQMKRSKKVRIILDYPSANARFHPIEDVRTRAVYITDDHVLASKQDVEFLYKVWQGNQDTAVGHYRASSEQNPESYDLVLSQSMFLRHDFLAAYTCLLPEQVHDFIDKHTGCKDVALNMLVSGMTANKPIAVRPTQLYEFGNLLYQPSNYSFCIHGLRDLFNGANLLLANDQVVDRSYASQSLVVPWSNWHRHVTSV
ncbi:Exostoses (Multiple)-like 3 [Apophysomyces sp. BC1034]|nr:Exostoses (Multiple)-like 3 [Apophysomyces sp. BC1021]KAG0185033.1 Exostoses (Multiple)-like 3 [Apophysomyces sp. BC1034]